MNAEELAAIRRRADAFRADESVGDADRIVLLAHIDALTAKVEVLPNAVVGDYIDRAAVLAILRGEA